MTVPLALQDRVLRRFELRRHRIPVRDGTLSIVAPRSMDDLLVGRHLERYERLGYLPYWADIWPASVALARAIARGPDLSGRRAMDLGCGVGVAGAGAAWRGAEVVPVDRDPDALQFAAFNARQNRAPQVTPLRHDFERSPVPGRFDRILLADVAYEQRLHGPLLQCVLAALAPDGLAVLADPFRAQADPLFARFAAELATRIVTTSVSSGGQRLAVRLCWAARNPAVLAAHPAPER